MASRDTSRRASPAKLCTPPASKQVPSYLYVVVVIGVVDTVDKWFLRRSGHVFYPLRLWAAAVDNRGVLWTGGSCAHLTHRGPLVLPSPVPRNTRVLPSPTHHLGVTPFTLPGDRPAFVAEQWTKMWRTCRMLCTTGRLLWASGGQLQWGTEDPVGRPQSVDRGCPHIHTHLSWAETSRVGSSVETFWTTPVSPGCGRPERHDPVEKSTAPPRNRTTRRAPGVGLPGRGVVRGVRRGRYEPVRALARAAGRQLLMRLVSSVTWL